MKIDFISTFTKNSILKYTLSLIKENSCKVFFLKNKCSELKPILLKRRIEEQIRTSFPWMYNIMEHNVLNKFSWNFHRWCNSTRNRNLMFLTRIGLWEVGVKNQKGAKKRPKSPIFHPIWFKFPLFFIQYDSNSDRS